VEPKDLWMNVALSAAPPQPGLSELPQAESLMTIEDLEKLHIERTLKHLHWNRVKTAKALGITPKTLYLKIKRYNIQVPRWDSPE